MIDIIIKGAMLGDFNVGKSSISQMYVHGEIQRNPTIGVDFHSKDISYRGYKVCPHLWDTAGQERFRSIVKVYARNIYIFSW
jgi:small GTP-binding protein